MRVFQTALLFLGVLIGSAAHAKPNILLIIADDMGLDASDEARMSASDLRAAFVKIREQK